uniref:Secreted protein n=1 Tax=Octopus bimaculoides TaxID=37653 RepID=A0A0L8GT55_OCTBM
MRLGRTLVRRMFCFVITIIRGTALVNDCSRKKNMLSIRINATNNITNKQHHCWGFIGTHGLRTAIWNLEEFAIEISSRKQCESKGMFVGGD